jgi:general secretion pathway protein N
MKRAVLWLAAMFLAVALTVLAFLPATWLGTMVEGQTGGRLTLGDAQGTLWRGSAFIGGAPGANGAVTPLLPGRFSWRLSPLVLLGRVDLQLENAQALSQPVNLRGSWSAWQVSPAALTLPAEGLAGLGAPLNTLAPSGRMALSWTTLDLLRLERTVALNGRTVLAMDDMGSRMSPVKPLGSYELAFDWRGQAAQDRGRLQFSGTAQAANGYEDTLGNLLNLLGQRRMVNGKNIIALEFK